MVESIIAKMIISITNAEVVLNYLMSSIEYMANRYQ